MYTAVTHFTAFPHPAVSIPGIEPYSSIPGEEVDAGQSKISCVQSIAFFRVCGLMWDGAESCSGGQRFWRNVKFEVRANGELGINPGTRIDRGAGRMRHLGYARARGENRVRVRHLRHRRSEALIADS